MSRLAKNLRAASATASLDIDEVFSTYLYTGNNTSQTITNNINLSGEGGLVWIKRRNNTASHVWVDTERGDDKYLQSDSDTLESTRATMLSFSSTGFSLDDGFSVTNGVGGDFTSWTFRKNPKLFNILTWTGDSVNGRTISHNLDSTVGCIMIKRRDSGADWVVWHRGYSPSNTDDCGILNSDIDFRFAGLITNVTSTDFTISDSARLNTSGGTYVAYIFAHNNGDGDFGPDADQDIIKCGSYTGNASTSGPSINLGFEPQWVLIKNASSTTNAWIVVDSMRGIGPDGPTVDDDFDIYASSDIAESPNNIMTLTSTGFNITSSASRYNGGSDTMVYIAIRRGPLAAPTSSSEVFAVDQGDATSTEPQYSSGFVVDMAFDRIVTSLAENNLGTRLTGNTYAQTQNSGQMTNANNDFTWDYMNGWYSSTRSTSYYSWMWRRAPGFFDVVTYKGTGIARTVSHNLGVAPEMMWIKRRDTSGSWAVFHKALDTTSGEKMNLNNDDGATINTAFFNSTAPTSTEFTVGTSNNTNDAFSGSSYVALLFATLPGISKVGSYTGDGTTGRVIDCGFSNGPKFVLIKQYDNTIPARWSFFDSQRGIVSGNDPQLWFDSLDAEDTGHDLIDTTPSGFIVNEDNTAFAYQEVNQLNDNYIFYAIAAP